MNGVHFAYSPQRISKAICRNTFLKQRSGLQEKGLRWLLSCDLNILAYVFRLCLSWLQHRLRVCGDPSLDGSSSPPAFLASGEKSKVTDGFRVFSFFRTTESKLCSVDSSKQVLFAPPAQELTICVFSGLSARV